MRRLHTSQSCCQSCSTLETAMPWPVITGVEAVPWYLQQCDAAQRPSHAMGTFLMKPVARQACCTSALQDAAGGFVGAQSTPGQCC